MSKIILKTAVLTAAILALPTNIMAQQKTVPEAAVPMEQSTPNEKEQPAKIVDKTHPDYMRCKSQKVIGSLAKRERICMTNAQWEQRSSSGNRGARTIMGDLQPGFAPQ